jgi:hypothetical protein
MPDLSLAGVGVPLLLLGGVIVIAVATLLLHLLFPPARQTAWKARLRLWRVRCPLCDQSLHLTEIGGVSVLICRCCQGVWLSRDKLEQILKLDRQSITTGTSVLWKA